MRGQASFFFYDLETSGFNPHQARIMQFAGRRTDLQLDPVGEPVNVLLRMTNDVLPDPDAVLITGITPQQTLAEGKTEADFLQQFAREIATPGTIFVGFNTIRFDDEFMRCLHYRNFYDPYEWQWQDDRSRWDLLDVARMTRALRPEGISWPFDTSGKPTNRLELLSSVNGLNHERAHDALSDVDATIAVARLIRTKQAKLFDYLLGVRGKREVAKVVGTGDPFVYTSGRYPSEFHKTTVAAVICEHPTRQGAFVFDLRHDPLDYKDSTPEQLADLWRWKKDAPEPRLPIKPLQFNRCPAIAPLGVLDQASQQRLGLDMAVINKHLASLRAMSDLGPRLTKAWEMLEKPEQTSLISTEHDVDESIYDGFFEKEDQELMRVVRAAEPAELGTTLQPHFTDKRLRSLLPLYKARNYPGSLTPQENEEWERYRAQKLLGGGEQSRMAKFQARLQDIATRTSLTEHQAYLVEELRLYAESVVPYTD